jgi:hypothetical protein
MWYGGLVVVGILDVGLERYFVIDTVSLRVQIVRSSIILVLVSRIHRLDMRHLVLRLVQTHVRVRMLNGLLLFRLLEHLRHVVGPPGRAHALRILRIRRLLRRNRSVQPLREVFQHRRIIVALDREAEYVLLSIDRPLLHSRRLFEQQPRSLSYAHLDVILDLRRYRMKGIVHRAVPLLRSFTNAKHVLHVRILLQLHAFNGPTRCGHMPPLIRLAAMLYIQLTYYLITTVDPVDHLRILFNVSVIFGVVVIISDLWLRLLPVSGPKFTVV